MSILPLSDFGYRRFGSLPPGGGGFDAGVVAQGAAQVSDYDVAGAWVRRRDRRRDGQPIEALRIVDVLDAGTDLGGDRLAFIADYLRNSEFANTDLPELTTDDDTLTRLLETAADPNEPRWRGMYRLSQALYYAGRHRLTDLFRGRIARASLTSTRRAESRWSDTATA